MTLSKRPRDSVETFLLYSVAAVLVGSLASAGLAAAVFFGALEGSVASALIGGMAAAFLIYFAYRLYRLVAASWIPLGQPIDGQATGCAQIISLPIIEVSVSASARRLIARQGGTAFVWLDDVGPSYALLRATTRDPGHREFRRHGVNGVDVLVAKEVDVPEVTLRASRLFPWRLVAEWPGAVTSGGF